MFLLVPAHPGFPGQIPQSRRTVVCCVFLKFLCFPVPGILGNRLVQFSRWWDASGDELPDEGWVSSTFAMSMASVHLSLRWILQKQVICFQTLFQHYSIELSP